MARIRTIKPDFMESVDTQALSRDARLFFLQLLTEVDDIGLTRYSPKRMAGVLYPGDDDVTASDIERWVAECARQDMVRPYDHEGQHYLSVTNFVKHQVVSKPSQSKCPPPPPISAGQGPVVVEAPGIPANPQDSPGIPAKVPGVRAVEREMEREVEKEKERVACPRRSLEAAIVALPSVDEPRWAEAKRLTELLADGVAGNGFKRPQANQDCVKQIEMMLRCDGLQAKEIEEIITWSQQDGFWYRNIRSTRKLREQFDRLRVDAKDPVRRRRSGDVAMLNGQTVPPTFLAINEMLEEERRRSVET